MTTIDRKYGRTRLLARVTVRPLRGCVPFPADLLDLGRGGAALFAGRFLAPRQPVELVPTGGGMGPRGRVANVRVTPDGNILGIDFERPLTTEELQALEVLFRDGATP